MPQIVILAGPNGAGKTTASTSLLRDRLGMMEFVNADAIAAGLSPFAPDTVALEAGRLMLDRMKKLADAGSDFAFETTLAARTYRPWLLRRLSEGYRATLFFLWLPTPDLAIQRVATRVRLGGHMIPDQVVRERYARGLRNFFMMYRSIMSEWSFYNSTAADDPELIAEGGRYVATAVREPLLWDTIAKEYGNAEAQ